MLATACVGCVFNDPVHTVKNVLHHTQQIFQAQAALEHDDQVRRISRSLDLFSSLSRYRMPNPPLLRTRWPDNLRAPAFAYVGALNSGDPSGAGYKAVTVPLAFVPDDLSTFRPMPTASQDMIRRSLGIAQAADAVIWSATDVAGRARGGRRGWRDALDLFEKVVTIASTTTKVVEQISAGTQMHAEQQQLNNTIHVQIEQQALLENLQEREASAGGVAFQLGVLAAEPASPGNPLAWEIR
ncbi:MAG: hypothetical protein ABJA98_21385 [Acidobacteriota bacterium]